MNMIRILAACLATAMLEAPVGSAEISEEATNALVNLNSSFIAAHVAANQANLAAGGPIILLRDGELVLIRSGTETSALVIRPEYEAFKTFAHMPVAIYLMLGPIGVGELDAERLDHLGRYRTKIQRVETNIDQIGLTGAQLQRQKQIVAASKQFLDRVIEQRRLDAEELHAFTRSMTPMIKANLAGAAKSQLNAMHRQMMAWKNELTADEWRKLRVAIKGAVLARDDNLAKQYFERLLQIEGEGMRLTYMERYSSITPMQFLLATRSVDQGIGIAIFDNPDRMFRDVLADAAAVYIEEMEFDQ